MQAHRKDSGCLSIPAHTLEEINGDPPWKEGKELQAALRQQRWPGQGQLLLRGLLLAFFTTVSAEINVHTQSCLILFLPSSSSSPSISREGEEPGGTSAFPTPSRRERIIHTQVLLPLARKSNSLAASCIWVAAPAPHPHFFCQQSKSGIWRYLHKQENTSSSQAGGSSGAGLPTGLGLMVDEDTAGRARLCPPTLTISYNLHLMVPFAERKGIPKELTHKSHMWKDAKTFSQPAPRDALWAKQIWWCRLRGGLKSCGKAAPLPTLSSPSP